MKKTGVEVMVRDDSEQLITLEVEISGCLNKLEQNLFETVAFVGGLLTEAYEVFKGDSAQFTAWVETKLDGRMSVQNARKWMRYVQGVRVCPALEVGDKHLFGFTARSVFASALLEERISEDFVEDFVRAGRDEST